jgi:hypothetical protein
MPILFLLALVLGLAWFYRRRSNRKRKQFEFRRWRMEEYRRTRSGR